MNVFKVNGHFVLSDEHLRCGNGLYVHKDRICDGWADCYETHDDETNCKNRCFMYILTFDFAITGKCLFVLGFYGPVNNEVMSSRSVNNSTVPGQV